MDEPLTEELLNELLSSASPAEFIESHDPQSRALADYLQQLLDERGLERKDVVRAANVDTTYGYMIFKGTRQRPNRDIVLQIAFAMGLTVRETDRLLQAAGASRLYCKNRRDAIIVFCLDRGATLSQTNEELFRLGEPTLGD